MKRYRVFIKVKLYMYSSTISFSNTLISYINLFSNKLILLLFFLNCVQVFELSFLVFRLDDNWLYQCTGKTSFWTVRQEQNQPYIISNAYFHTFECSFTNSQPRRFTPSAVHILCLPATIKLVNKKHCTFRVWFPEQSRFNLSLRSI